MFHRTGNLDPLSAEELRYARHVLRVQVDARILANQPQHDIALAMGLPVEVVTEYESRFFDNRKLLLKPDLMWGLVIGGRPDDVLHPDQVVRFWYGIGYKHGIAILEPYLTMVDRDKLLTQGLLAYLRRDTKLSLDLKLLVAKECCQEIRTEQGMDVAREIAALPNWNSVLTASRTRATVFGRVVSLLRKEVEDKERKECRLRKKEMRASVVYRD